MKTPTKLELAKKAQKSYQKGTPIMTDEEYDRLVHDNNLQEELSIGLTDSVDIAHPTKMYSLKDIFTTDELGEWITKIKKENDNVKLYPEMKYDGVSLNLIYVNGKLDKAITRGDGTMGLDVTETALKAINNIPPYIEVKETIEVRGEVCISFSNFKKINERREVDGLKTYSNPRNLAAGSMMLKDIEECQRRKLDFIAWGLVSNPMGKHSDIINVLDSNHFYTSQINLKAVTSLESMYEDSIKKRRESRYPLDGIVIKVDDVKVTEELGYTNKFPRHMVALKFPPIEKSTRLINIRWQIGTTGALTPVADLIPVSIDGSTVSKVTLHNKRHIEAMDIMINDEIVIIKSGDIIPKLTHIIKDKRNDGREVLHPIYPKVCFACNSKIQEDDINLFCVNPTCPAVIRKTISRFVDRKHFNIRNVSEAMITKLMVMRLIQTPLDLLRLDKVRLLKARKGLSVTESGIDKMLKAISKSKTIALDKFISALCISNIGTTFGGLIRDNFDLQNPHAIFDLSADELMKIDGIGETSARNFTEYINKYPDYIKGLIDEVDLIDTNKHGAVRISVGISGSFDLSRSELKEKYEKLGINICGLSKKNDYYLRGDKASESKIAKISQYVKEITLSELEEI